MGPPSAPAICGSLILAERSLPGRTLDLGKGEGERTLAWLLMALIETDEASLFRATVVGVAIAVRKSLLFLRARALFFIDRKFDFRAKSSFHACLLACSINRSSLSKSFAWPTRTRLAERIS